MFKAAAISNVPFFLFYAIEIASVVTLQYVALFLPINLDLYLSRPFLYPDCATLENGNELALVGLKRIPRCKATVDQITTS